MRIVSFNINSIRARPHQLIHIRDTLNPDVIGLQETKVNDPDFPLEVIEEIGYHPEYWGQKGHYGVAFLSKEKPIKTVKGFKKDTDEDQKRFIECTFKAKDSEITIMNGYFPQGESIHHETKFPKKINGKEGFRSPVTRSNSVRSTIELPPRCTHYMMCVLDLICILIPKKIL